MILTFIGNCQTLTLCYFFQQLFATTNLDYKVSWILYGKEFIQHIGEWSDKCQNKIMNPMTAVDLIKKSDVIIFQEVNVNKSPYSNTKTLTQLIKKGCQLIKIPSAHLLYDEFDTSIQELCSREDKNYVDVKFSSILYQFRERNLMLSPDHPNTFFFMEIMKKLCLLLQVAFFTDEEYAKFLENENYMGLP